MTHTSKLSPPRPERTVTLSIRVPVSLAEKADTEVSLSKNDETTSDFVRVAMEREVTRRERLRRSAA